MKCTFQNAKLINIDLGGIGGLDGGRVLTWQHGSAVNGLALGKEIGMSLTRRLFRAQPLQGARGRTRTIPNFDHTPKEDHNKL